VAHQVMPGNMHETNMPVTGNTLCSSVPQRLSGPSSLNDSSDRATSLQYVAHHMGRLLSSGIPRTDQLNAGVHKVADITSRKSRIPVAANCGDLTVGHADLEPAELPDGNDIRIVDCGQRIERQDSVAEILRQQSVDFRAKLTPASAVRQSGDPAHNSAAVTAVSKMSDASKL
jgi:hypothetical protein